MARNAGLSHHRTAVAKLATRIELAEDGEIVGLVLMVGLVGMIQS